MIVNGSRIAKSNIFDPFTPTKERAYGVSYGLAEAGYDVRIAQDVWLHPLRRFKLASTVERFTMPSNMMAIVHDKSTWARRGLSVFNTVIEPGWEGWLTLELVYYGWTPLRIRAGSGIAQVMLHQTTEQASYSGKYQGQANKPVSAILEEKNRAASYFWNRSPVGK